MHRSLGHDIGALPHGLEIDGAADEAVSGERDKVQPGWDKKPTDRPTSFMMSTVFQQIMVAHLEGEAYVLKPLSGRQQLFLQALGLDERVFMTEVVPTLTYMRSSKPSD